jgi:hypothetical protein
MTVKLFDKLKGALTKPIQAIEDHVSKEVAGKTRVGIETVFQSIDAASPVLADLLAGNQIRLIVTLQLEEVHKGAAFTGPKE